jgi:hypothetical protein
MESVHMDSFGRLGRRRLTGLALAGRWLWWLVLVTGISVVLGGISGLVLIGFVRMMQKIGGGAL